MNKFLKSHPIISSLVLMYKLIRLEYRIFTCKHDYIYWDTIFEEVRKDGLRIKSNFPNFECSHRQCLQCGKKESLKTTVGDWGWKRVNYDFPKHGKPFVGLYNPYGYKSLQERRDDVLDKLLK